MVARTDPTPVTVPPGLPITHDLHDAITTWSTSQRAVIGLAADFADSGEWSITRSVSAAHWIAAAADIEVCTAREWIRVGRRLRLLPVIARRPDVRRCRFDTTDSPGLRNLAGLVLARVTAERTRPMVSGELCDTP